ncbi:DNA topoisomerase (ATP-hydrolyzing) [Trifolium repens]|nr:DNA topoisomerase (ATP-hydrolyzing) [Trifolium repens]
MVQKRSPETLSPETLHRRIAFVQSFLLSNRLHPLLQFSHNKIDSHKSLSVTTQFQSISHSFLISSKGEDFKKDTLQYHKIIILTDGAHILHGRRQTSWIP